jgi:hypothetical protein
LAQNAWLDGRASAVDVFVDFSIVARWLAGCHGWIFRVFHFDREFFKVLLKSTLFFVFERKRGCECDGIG